MAWPIAAYLIIYRVADGTAWTRETMETQTLTSAQARPPSDVAMAHRKPSTDAVQFTTEFSVSALDVESAQEKFSATVVHFGFTASHIESHLPRSGRHEMEEASYQLSAVAGHGRSSTCTCKPASLRMVEEKRLVNVLSRRLVHVLVLLGEALAVSLSPSRRLSINSSLTVRELEVRLSAKESTPYVSSNQSRASTACGASGAIRVSLRYRTDKPKRWWAAVTEESLAKGGRVQAPSFDLETANAWTTCAQVVEEHHKWLVKRWKDEIDTLLVYAGLFSAVLTAFNVELYVLLMPDSTDTTNALLAQISAQLSSFALNPNFANSTQPFAPPPSTSSFRAAASSVWINTLWFSSLICSLSAASIGMLVKQWLHESELGLSGTSREAARLRQRTI
ncbi:hypothetical protein NUW54_g1673 [Trametes sanguinea]|uniref:Uncharacterized protein n=1 Tax=Trametes sanguinea TaxID=158606 RepID=A0ACC1Q7K2_9APHY|nr:hypothetical protein NUW54_g1673 [Trametes sanguinea]